MKPEYSNKHESLKEFSYKKIEDTKSKKPNLSEPKVLFSLKNANIAENYDEIDFIEEILSEDVKKKMSESGIKFRNKSVTTSLIQPENLNVGILDGQAEDPHRESVISGNTTGLQFSRLNEEEKENSFVSEKNVCNSNPTKEISNQKDIIVKSVSKQNNTNKSLDKSIINQNNSFKSNDSYNSITNPPNELTQHENISQKSQINQSNISNKSNSTKKVDQIFVNNSLNIEKNEENQNYSHVELKLINSEEDSIIDIVKDQQNLSSISEKNDADKHKKIDTQNTFEKIMPIQTQQAYYNEINHPETMLRAQTYQKIRSKNKVKCPIYKFNVIPDMPQSQKILYEKIAEEFPEKSEAFFDEAFIRKQTDIYEEVNKRINEKKNEIQINSSPGEGPKKFYLENQPVVVFIDGCARMNDLRHSNLYGILYIKEGGNVYKPHWFEFKNNHLTCLNQEENKITPLVVPNELNGDVIHPQNNEIFLTKKFLINVYESRVYLVKNRVKYAGFLKCPFFTKEDFPELIDITEQRITKYYKIKNYYDLEISTTTGPICVRVSYLEFALENSGNYIFFRVDNPDVFIRWLTAISFRQGRQWFEVR